MDLHDELQPRPYRKVDAASDSYHLDLVLEVVEERVELPHERLVMLVSDDALADVSEASSCCMELDVLGLEQFRWL